MNNVFANKVYNLKIFNYQITLTKIPLLLLLLSIIIIAPYGIFQYIDITKSESFVLSLNMFPLVGKAYGLFESPKQPLITYDDNTFNFKIDYPLNWEKSVKINNEITFVAPKEMDSVSSPAGLIIKIIPSNNNPSLKNVSVENAAKSLVTQLKKEHKDFKLESSKFTSIGGKKAIQIVFTATDNMLQNRKAMQIVTVNNNNIFIITYKANPDKFASYEGTIKDMLSSFKFKIPQL